MEFEVVCRRLKRRVLDAVVRERWGDDAARVMTVVLKHEKMDEKHVSKSYDEECLGSGGWRGREATYEQTTRRVEFEMSFCSSFCTDSPLLPFLLFSFLLRSPK